MRLIRARREDFDLIYAEMEKSFVKEERRDKEDALEALKNDKYSVYLAQKNGMNVGFVTVWELSGFAFIEHLATCEAHRNKGYGSEVLSLLKKKYSDLVLEAEPPIESIQKRRIAFYERNGFVRNPQKYIQPAYRAGGQGVELVLMSCPKMLDNFENTVREIYYNVYDNGGKT